MAENFVDFGVVKKPQNDAPLTVFEEAEGLKCADDPWYFFTKYCYVVSPKGKLLFEPRDYQVDLLDDIFNNRFVICNSPRQTGKCVGKTTKYIIRNKQSGEKHELSAKEFHSMVKGEAISRND